MNGDEWTVSALKQYTDRIVDDLEERLDRASHRGDDLVDRVTAIERWKATVGGRTLALLGIIGLFTGFLGVVLGHLLYG